MATPSLGIWVESVLGSDMRDIVDGGVHESSLLGYDELPIAAVTRSLDYVPGLSHPSSPVYRRNPRWSMLIYHCLEWRGWRLMSSDDDTDDDDADDDDEEPFEDEEEEEEHLAPTDSPVIPIVDAVPSARDTKAFETDESAPTPRPPQIRIPFAQTRLRRARKTVRPEPPMSASMEARIAEHAAAPTPPLPVASSPLPLPSPLTTSPTDTGAPLGYRAAGIRMRAAVASPPLLLPPTSPRTDVPEAEMPPRKRACLTTPAPGYEIGESSAAGAARQPRPTPEVDTWDEIVEAMMEIAPTTLEGVDQRVTELDTTVRQRTEEFEIRFEEARDDRAYLGALVNSLYRDRPYHRHTALAIDREAVYARIAWTSSEERSAAIEAHVRTLEAQVATLIAQTTSLQTQLTTALGRIATLEAKDPKPQDGPAEAGNSSVAVVLAEHDASRSKDSDNNHGSGTGQQRSRLLDTMGSKRWNCFPYQQTVLITNKVKYASCTLQGSTLTWWNSHVRVVGQDVAYTMPWTALKRMITDKYCPRGEIKKLESEYWNLKVRGHYKSDCPKLKNRNQGNRAGNGNVVARAYVVGSAGTNLNSNVVTEVEVYYPTDSFSSLIDIIPTTLDHGYDVELADGRIIWVNTLIRGCTLNFLNHPFNIDLMPVEMGSFDVIIGMDWLAKYHAVIVCDEETCSVSPLEDKTVIFHGDGKCNNGHESRLNIILCTKTQKVFAGGLSYLSAKVTMKKTEDESKEKQLEDVL
ncbi:putative reverse transcriptase domain-containing protein [Tanacetum coccineum]